jgi:hypothetical protein
MRSLSQCSEPFWISCKGVGACYSGAGLVMVKEAGRRMESGEVSLELDLKAHSQRLVLFD